ncbi:hypothetical protein [Methylobacterium nigriterrae]|uniref:hypothetical protein n=1 Tax=Methylobacterium nigriterrae TaxID=3127512 RepID=UPI00301405BA
MPELDREIEHLPQAHRHLEDRARRVADQTIVIEEMTAKGYGAILAENLLRAMERTPEEGRKHQQRIVEALA